MSAHVGLSELYKYINKMVNVIGVVVEFSIPRRSGGTDYFTSFRLVDQTQQNPEIGANIFMKDIDQLPHIRSRFDIILLSNVRVEEFEHRLSVVYNKSYSKYALFDGKDYNNDTPYQISPTFGRLGIQQSFLVRQLKTWNQGFSVDAGISDFVVQIKDAKEGVFLDIVCKILHAHLTEENRWIIYLWDGTDAPPLSLNTELGDDISNQLALHIESSPLPADVLRKFPCVGTVLTVFVDKSYGNLGDHFKSFDTWVRLRNFRFEQHPSGLWMGHLESRTKFRLLTENDNSVKERLRYHENRIEESRQPTYSLNLSEFLTVTNHSGCYVTLMDLLTLTQSGGVFKCIVRFVSVFPFQSQQLWSLSGNGYAMLMTLEDPTARIHALLCEKDAEKFFGGHPGLEIVATKVKKLLGLDNGYPRNPPWTEVCISVFPCSERDPSGRHQFHLCHTSFAHHS